jgi:hypothetical protein
MPKRANFLGRSGAGGALPFDLRDALTDALIDPGALGVPRPQQPFDLVPGPRPGFGAEPLVTRA